MAKTHDLFKSAGIIIRDRRLLVEKSFGKNFFIAPGGSIEAGETATQALVRELREEFQIVVSEHHLEPFGEFSAEGANHPGLVLHMQVFTVTRWQGEPTPDNEVERIAWVNSTDVDKLPIGSIFAHEVIPRLRARRLID